MFRYVICVTCDHLLLSRALEKQKNWTHRQAKECVVPCPRLVHCMRFAEPWAGKGEEIQNELKQNWRNHSTVLFNLWMVHCFMSHSYELWQSGQCAHDIVSLSDRSKGRIKAWRHRRKQDLTWCIFFFCCCVCWCAKQLQNMHSNTRIVIRISNFVVSDLKTDHSRTETWKILDNPWCFSHSPARWTLAPESRHLATRGKVGVECPEFIRIPHFLD